MDPSDPGLASARSQWVTRTLGLVGHPIFRRHPSLRWLAPAGVLGVIAVAATGMLNAGASSENLPSTTPAALIAAVQAPDAPGFSGTVVSRVSLGLPELPSFGSSALDGASMASLLIGTHTLQVWYGSAVKQRIALLGATEETDLFRDGRQLWHWNSADRVAVHTLLPATTASVPASGSTPSIATPDALAHEALAAVQPSTRITVHENQTVADRSAYEMVLTPRSATTRIGSVHIAIDGATKVPLGVQVYPRHSDRAAIDVAYTSIHFVQPADTYFRFAPPTGAKVRRVHAGSVLSQLAERLEHPFPVAGRSSLSAPSASAASAVHRVSVSGTGWSTVFGYDTGKKISVPDSLDAALRRVHGSWGRGRLLDTSLVSVLVTNGGRVYAGAVDPSALYAAAGRN